MVPMSPDVLRPAGPAQFLRIAAVVVAAGVGLVACGGGSGGGTGSADLCSQLAEPPADVEVDAQGTVVLRTPPQFAAASTYFASLADVAPDGAMAAALERTSAVLADIAAAAGGSDTFDAATAGDNLLGGLVELGEDPEVTDGLRELESYAVETCGLTDGPIDWSPLD
jgi:hypothetical protein